MLPNKQLSEYNYSQLLTMPQWQHKRRIILNRDGNQCRSCGSRHGLHVHHRQYHTDAKTGQRKMPWDYANRYLITLCANCHQNGHMTYDIPVFSI
jgi:5-methylcytosine-specific restriction endonuclease McrA